MLLSIPVEFTYEGFVLVVKKILNSILMPVSISTQKEFLSESKLNGLSVLLLPWFTHGGLYLLVETMTPYIYKFTCDSNDCIRLALHVCGPLKLFSFGYVHQSFRRKQLFLGMNNKDIVLYYVVIRSTS